MPPALVSVVVPVYNGARYLGPALESLLAQDYEPIEVIVVDDGSNDGSGDVARSFGGVRVCEQANAGPAAARNVGIAAATGEFVAFHDADDLVPPTRLTLQLDYLTRHPEIDCVLGRQEWIDPPPWLTRDAVYGELGGIPTSSAVYRAPVLRELGGFDVSLRTGEDIDLLIRLRETGHR
jgi:glycosyltransferase involved in cell wall biosynthesis